MSIKANRGHANDGLSSALLVVFLDSARNLPVSQSAPTSQHAPEVVLFKLMFIVFLSHSVETVIAVIHVLLHKSELFVCRLKLSFLF